MLTENVENGLQKLFDIRKMLSRFKVMNLALYLKKLTR